MTARLATLQEIEAACWQELERAARQRGHLWRTMALATRDGEGADARLVVLREARPTSRELLFYTDDRSPKLTQLLRHPRGTLLLWSSELGWQLRARVQLEQLPDGLEVSSRWARLKLSPAAQDYLSPLAPGAPLGSGPAAPGGRDFFAVVLARVGQLDWLELHADGHRRAIFGDGPSRWVQP